MIRQWAREWKVRTSEFCCKKSQGMRQELNGVIGSRESWVF